MFKQAHFIIQFVLVVIQNNRSSCTLINARIVISNTDSRSLYVEWTIEVSMRFLARELLFGFNHASLDFVWLCFLVCLIWVFSLTLIQHVSRLKPGFAMNMNLPFLKFGNSSKTADRSFKFFVLYLMQIQELFLEFELLSEIQDHR